MQVFRHSVTLHIVPPSLLEHLRTLHRDPVWVRLLAMGLVYEAVLVGVNVHDHLKGNGPVASSSANTQVAEDAIAL